MRDKRRHCEAVNSTSLRAVFWRGNLMQVIQSSKRDCFVPRQLRPRQLLLGKATAPRQLLLHCSTYGRPALMLTPLTYVL